MPLVRIVVIALALVSLVTVGCSSSEEPAESSTTTVDPMTTDPRLLEEQAAEEDLEQFAFGQEVRVTDEAIVPASLVAILDTEVTITNETASPITLRFTNGPYNDAGDTEATIDAGGTWAFTPTRITSHRVTVVERPELTGQIQVDPGVDE